MDGSQSNLPPGLKRRLFTAADVQAMLDAGVLGEGDHHVELIRGELIEMSPQGPLHWNLTQGLAAFFWRNLPAHLAVASNGPLRLSEHDEPEPEVFVFPDGMDVNDVRGPDVLLVIEVSHSSLRVDLDVKAPLYAAHGVREYWVVDIEGRRTHVHRLVDRAYGAPDEIIFGEVLTAPGGAQLVIASILAPPKA
jgi:Uma2 family endonuclease